MYGQTIDMLPELKQRLERVNLLIQECHTFREWAQTARTKKAIVYRSKQVFGDWRSYALKNTPSGELLIKVEEITERSIREATETRDKLQAKIDQIAADRERASQKNEVSDRLMKILDARLELDPEFLPRRQIDCLIALIEDGDLATENELAEYIGA